MSSIGEVASTIAGKSGAPSGNMLFMSSPLVRSNTPILFSLYDHDRLATASY